MISHDLAIVAHMSSQIGVLYLGEFMEIGSHRDFVNGARHPYTAALIAASSKPDPVQTGGTGNTTVATAAGESDIASPVALPRGCSFQTRCPHRSTRCSEEKPLLRQLGESHWIRCHHDITALPIYQP